MWLPLVVIVMGFVLDGINRIHTNAVYKKMPDSHRVRNAG